MNMNLKWIIVAVSMGSLGFLACGSDDEGGGKKDSGNICDETSARYDEDSCLECVGKLMECRNAGKCSDELGAAFACRGTQCAAETDAVEQCELAADDPCSDAHPDSFGDYLACVEAACASEIDALDSCSFSKCASERGALLACFERDCPEATACLGSF